MPKGRTDLERSIADLSDVESGVYYTLREGKNRFRILPAWTGKGPHAGKFFFKGFLHFGFRTEGRNRAFPCQSSFEEGANCPTCAFIEVLREEGSEQSDQVARRLRRQPRYWVNVIDRRNEVAGPKIYGMRRRQMRTLRGYLQDPDYGDVTDPQDGRDVIIERTGSGLQTQYEVRLAAKNTPVGVEGWEEKLHKLHKVVLEKISDEEMVKQLKMSFGKLYAKAMGLTTKKDEEEEEEEAPKPKKKADEEEEEEEEEE